MKIGILGGTFNPVHLAHLRIAEEVREACGLDRVLFLVADTPPHKPVAGDVPFVTRLAMVEAAIADHPAFAACAIEHEHPGPNYTVDTLQRLRERHPRDSFYFIIGFDSFRELPSWKDYTRIPELTHLVVVHRPGAETAEPMRLLPVAVQKQFCYSCSPEKWRHQSGNWLIFLRETRLDISSTAIRRLVAERRSIRYLVPDPVIALIAREGLYRM